MKSLNQIALTVLSLYAFFFVSVYSQDTFAAEKTISKDFEGKAKEIATQNISTDSVQSIKIVELSNRNLCIYVEGYEKIDPKPLPKEAIGEVAYTCANRIAENILNKLTNYESLWDVITIDFVSLGEVRFYKKTVKQNQYGRYFPNQYTEKKNQPWFTLDKTSKSCYR